MTEKRKKIVDKDIRFKFIERNKDKIVINE